MATPALPSALSQIDVIRDRASRQQLIVFLDYDGTLTPIVDRPEEARLSGAMRADLTALARLIPVAIVSGRDLADVQRHVALDGLYYAGSHGFEIAGPDQFHDLYAPANAFLADLDRAEAQLRQQLATLSGTQVERKQFAIAVHYRRATKPDIEIIDAIVNATQEATPSLRRTGGKKVFELRPDLEWHKGAALFWLIDVMGYNPGDVMPVYIGDDVTDEDAFAAVDATGWGILVAKDPRPTQARWGLAHPGEVQAFLSTLAVMPRNQS